MQKLIFAVLYLTHTAHAVCPNGCSGQGTCDANDVCTCFDEGKTLYFGNERDPTKGRNYAYSDRADGLGVQKQKRFTGADCSLHTCPRGMSWKRTELTTRSYCGDPRFLTQESCVNVCLDTSQTTRAACIASDGTWDGSEVTGFCARYGYTSQGACEGQGFSFVTHASISKPETQCKSQFHYDANHCEAFANANGTMPNVFVVGPPQYCSNNTMYTKVDTEQKCTEVYGVWQARVWKTDEIQTHQDNVECSDAGLCDRTVGSCNCFEGYEGSACQRTTCVNDCNGHGICQSNMKFAVDAGARYENAWDSGNHYGCKCDSGYRGADCSLVECPSSRDPLHFEGNDEGRDCSGRGVCDYGTGLCQCFPGYTKKDCSHVEALA